MKFKRISIAFLISLIFISSSCYAKYSYYFEEVIIEFTRDDNLPICSVSYSSNELTNENVIITIECNKEIEQVSGFSLSENKKLLTKEVSENESKKIPIRDLSGNQTEIEYSVENIDKEPPQIIGIENGGIYDAPISLDYSDNREVEGVEIDQYGYELKLLGQQSPDDLSKLTVHITEHPLYTKKYRYYVGEKLYSTITDSSYILTDLENDCEIKVEALDELGNVLDEAILEKIVSNYDKKQVEKDENELTERGNYQVIARDTAGNESVYYIKIK